MGFWDDVVDVVSHPDKAVKKVVGKATSAVVDTAKSVGKSIAHTAKTVGKSVVKGVSTAGGYVAEGVKEAGKVASKALKPVSDLATDVAVATGTQKFIKGASELVGEGIRWGQKQALKGVETLGTGVGEIAHLIDEKQDPRKYGKALAQGTEAVWNVSAAINPLSRAGHLALNVSDTVAGKKQLGQALIDQSDLSDVGDVAGVLSTEKTRKVGKKGIQSAEQSVVKEVKREVAPITSTYQSAKRGAEKMGRNVVKVGAKKPVGGSRGAYIRPKARPNPTYRVSAKVFGL